MADKAFDFSPEWAVERWDGSRAAADAFLDALEQGRIEVGPPGLMVYRGKEVGLDAGTFRLTPAETAG